MYRCSICKDVSKAGEPRKVHIIHRTVTKAQHPQEKVPRQEVASELPVCQGCHHELERGISLSTLILDRGVYSVPPSFLFTTRPKIGPITVGRSVVKGAG